MLQAADTGRLTLSAAAFREVKMKRNYKMILQYDGTRYFGWEHQPDQVGVQPFAADQIPGVGQIDLLAGEIPEYLVAMDGPAAVAELERIRLSRYLDPA